MNIPDKSFFDEIDLLGLNTDDPVQAEMREETAARSPEQADNFNNSGSEPETVEAETVTGEETKRVKFNYKASAGWIVRILDGVNVRTLPPLYTRKMLNQYERSKVVEYDAMEAQGQSYQVTPEDERILEKRDRIRQLVDAVPMADDEKAELTEALADVMEEGNVQISPTAKLLLTLGMVEGVRLLPLLSSNKDSNANQ